MCRILKAATVLRAGGETGRYPVALVFLPIFLLIFTTGCETMQLAKIKSLTRTAPEARILLMPPDVELAALTAGGLYEPKAEWTKAALKHMMSAIREETSANKIRIIDYQTDGEPTPTDRDELQLIKLHGVVGISILIQRYRPQLILPTKRKNKTLDWSLGQAVRRLRKRYDADYALFIFVRDSYATEGRAALMAVTAILSLGRVIPRGGAQIGFASLVDLQSGEIVWFNPLARAEGDLRTAGPAKETIKQLLTGLPK